MLVNSCLLHNHIKKCVCKDLSKCVIILLNLAQGNANINEHAQIKRIAFKFQ